MAYLDYNGLAYFKQKNDALYAKATDLSNLSDVVAQKANIDGSYELLTSGNAEQLISTVGVENNAPYVFRTTGGSADVGDRMNLKAVIGGTVAWNQLLNKTNFQADGYQLRGLTVTNDGSGMVTVSGTFDATGYIDIYQQTYFYTVSGHKYLVSTPSLPSGVSEYNTIVGGGGLAYKSSNGAFIVSGAQTGSAYTLFRIPASVPANTVFTNYKVYINLFDLTLLLGSTIADYIYALEQSNAGAGVAYFRKLFPKSYYAYNASSMMSAETSAHKMVGFNQFDKSKAVNSERFNTTGTAGVAATYSRSDWIRVVPNTAYYFKDIVGYYDIGCVYWYDADKNFIKGDNINGYSPQSGYFTSPTNAYYVGINFRTVDIDSVCVSLRWDGERDGEYEPYQEWNYPLDSSLTLRGILKLDANNNLYADGDRYLPDGTVIRKRRQIVADGDTVKVTEVNQSNGTYWCCLTTLSSANKGVNSTTTETRIITDKGYRDYPGVGVGNIYITNNGISPIICLFDQTLTTVSAVNTYLASNPITIEYELETPTTESADAYTELQICNDFGTEEFVDAATRDFEMPICSLAIYNPNLRAKLEMAPNSPSNGNGDYIVRQTDGLNEYVALSDNSIVSGLTTRCPACPTDTDGTFVLKATVSGGAVTYSWVSE